VIPRCSNGAAIACCSYTRRTAGSWFDWSELCREIISRFWFRLICRELQDMTVRLPPLPAPASLAYERGGDMPNKTEADSMHRRGSCSTPILFVKLQLRLYLPDLLRVQATRSRQSDLVAATAKNPIS
jgi:hypothetical protein